MPKRPSVRIVLCFALGTLVLTGCPTDDAPRARREVPRAPTATAVSSPVASPDSQPRGKTAITVRDIRVAGDTTAHVMRIPKSQIYRVRVASAAWSFPSYPPPPDNEKKCEPTEKCVWLPTSIMAKRMSASFAVNGDFGLPPGIPGHGLILGGRLISTSQLGTRGKALSLGASGASIGRNRVTIRASVIGEGTWEIDAWNDYDTEFGDVVGFTADGPAGNIYGCGLVVEPGGDSGFGGDSTHVYLVKSQSCPAPRPTGEEVVLVAGEDTPFWRDVSKLAPKTRMAIGWNLRRYGVLDALGGSPILVEDRKAVFSDECNSYLCAPNPRTGVGITANGDMLMVVVDGRQDDSKGLAIGAFARLFKKLGAVDAINLDGGGSSTMIAHGQLASDPSDVVPPGEEGTGERPVTTALVVLDPDAAASTAYMTPEKALEWKTYVSDMGAAISSAWPAWTQEALIRLSRP